MTEPFGEPSHDTEADHLVETPESLRDFDPEAPSLDRGIEESDDYLAADRFGTTAAEEREGESLDQRLAEEEPDVGEEVATGEPEPLAGRLVEPDEGAHEDFEKDAVARDVGLDAGGLSAEEAAIHVVDEG